MDEKNNEKTEVKSKQDKRSLLRGATIFFVLVVYFNIRGGHKIVVTDWAVIIVGALIFIYSLVKYIKDKNS